MNKIYKTGLICSIIWVTKTLAVSIRRILNTVIKMLSCSRDLFWVTPYIFKEKYSKRQIVVQSWSVFRRLGLHYSEKVKCATLFKASVTQKGFRENLLNLAKFMDWNWLLIPQNYTKIRNLRSILGARSSTTTFSDGMVLKIHTCNLKKKGYSGGIFIEQTICHECGFLVFFQTKLPIMIIYKVKINRTNHLKNAVTCGCNLTQIPNIHTGHQK